MKTNKLKRKEWKWIQNIFLKPIYVIEVNNTFQPVLEVSVESR